MIELEPESDKVSEVLESTKDFSDACSESEGFVAEGSLRLAGLLFNGCAGGGLVLFEEVLSFFVVIDGGEATRLPPRPMVGCWIGYPTLRSETRPRDPSGTLVSWS